MDYAALQAQFSALLNRRDCTTAQVQAFIQQAIVQIQRDLRVPAMEKSVQITVGGVGNATLTGITGSPAVLSFSALPSGLAVGNTVADLTNDNSIPADTTVASIAGTNVTLSGPTSCTVGDNIQFTTSNYTWQGLPIPTDFLELINIIPVSDAFDEERLEKVDITKALQLSAVPGMPEVYSRQGGYWILGPAPTQGNIIQIDYYGEFTPVVNGTDTNILLTIAWDLVLYLSLTYACDFYTDKRKGSQVNPVTGKVMDGFEGRYNKIFESLTEMAEDDDDNGAASVQPAYAWPPDYYDHSQVNWGVVP